MSTNKTTTASTPSPHKRIRRSAERTAAIKCRQHERYKEFSADKRETLLLRRRTKQFQSWNEILPNASSTSKNNEEMSSTKFSTGLPRQTTITIKEPSHVTEKDGASITTERGKKIVEYFCIFEEGSTSKARCARHYLEAMDIPNKGLEQTTANVHNATNVTRRNTGSKRSGINCWNIKQLPNNARILKKVPNCQFCGAKRLEYESAGFCCSSGSVKLAPNEMPADLLNLYLGR